MRNVCMLYKKNRTFDVINVHIIAKNLKIKSSRCLKREEIGHIDVPKQVMAKETLLSHATKRTVSLLLCVVRPMFTINYITNIADLHTYSV